MEQQQRFLIFHIAESLFDFIVRVTIGDEQINVAVIVVIEKLNSPAAHQSSDHANMRGNRDIVERLVMIVVIKRIHFLVDVGDKQVCPSILIVIRSVHTHARARSSIHAVAHAGLQRDFFEPSLTAVDEQEVGHGIVGHPQIHPAVVINVCRHDAPCLAHGLPDVRQVSDFREGPVAIVVKEPARRGIVNTRNAVIAVARLGVAAELVFGFVKVDEAAHKKVESAIIIIVKPDGAGSPTRGSDTSLLGDIGKRTVAIVAIENATAILCQVKVGEAVAVIIPNCHTHPVSARCDARLPRNVCECAVPVVVIESVAKRRLRVIEVATTAVDQVDVHPAVVVVIEEGTAGSSSFRQKHLRRAPVTVHPSDPTDRWRNLFERLRRSRTCTPLRVPKIRPYEDVCGAGE